VETTTSAGSNHGHVATSERQHRAAPALQENPARDWCAQDQEWREDQPWIAHQVRPLLQEVYVAHFQHGLEQNFQQERQHHYFLQHD
jgi:hypothetical protein